MVTHGRGIDLDARIEYQSDVLNAETAQRVAAHYVRLLRALTLSPTLPMARVSVDLSWSVPTPSTMPSSSPTGPIIRARCFDFHHK